MINITKNNVEVRFQLDIDIEIPRIVLLFVSA